MTTRKTVSAREALKDILKSSFGEYVKSIRECDEVSQTETTSMSIMNRTSNA